MQFDGSDLRNILREQTAPVELRDSRGYVRRALCPSDALAVVRGGRFVGVGNTGRIRFIRPTETAAGFLAEDSITTVGPRPETQTHHPRRCAAYGGRGVKETELKAHVRAYNGPEMV